MIATYVNRYTGLITYFNGGVPFNEGFTEQDMINRAIEIFEDNFSEDYQLTEIITG